MYYWKKINKNVAFIICSKHSVASVLALILVFLHMPQSYFSPISFGNCLQSWANLCLESWQSKKQNLTNEVNLLRSVFCETRGKVMKLMNALWIKLMRMFLYRSQQMKLNAELRQQQQRTKQGQTLLQRRHL